MKRLALLLTLLIVLSSADGCSQQAGEATQAPAAPATDASASADDPYAGLPMEVSITTLDRAAVSAAEGSYEDNRWVDWINANSPVKVTIVPVPRTESTARINTLFASGTAPDLVWEFGKGFMDGLFAQGVLQPVDEYIEKYSTSYRQYLETNPELMPYLMQNDGRQYGMTSMRNIETIPNHAMWIRQDWLDQFGMDTPQTTEEVIAFMNRVRDEDPDGNGVDDTFGMGFNYNRDGILTALFGQPFGNFIVEDGQFVDWTATKGYEDYLAFKAMLYQEGYIDPEYITDDQFTRQRQLLVTGKTGIYLGSWNMENEWRELKQNVPEAEWVPFEPFETAYGRNGLFQEPPAHRMICMNKDAANPKAIMAYMDWMITDGWYPLTYGEEGVHYNLVDGVPQVIDPDLNKEQIGYCGEYALVDQNQITYDWFPIRAAQDALSQEYVPLKVLGNQTALKNEFKRFIPYTHTSDAIIKFSTDLGQQTTAIETNIIIGEISVADGLAEINSFKEANGWSAINEEINQWYQDNKDMLQ